MPTILVADDNSNIQKMVSLVFKEKGINVVAVGNGEAACRKVPEVHPDVVLADVFMPVRNGYEVCEFVKQDPQFAETPVILLVGAFDPLDEKEAQRVGANGVLKKPFVPPEPLITMVSSLLKIEPHVEEPQSPPAQEEASMPQSPAEPGPTARQRAIASAQAQYAATDEDEAVTTFNAPIAMPSPQSQEIDEGDSEPASEWAKRRATMDYEIDAADSADMVEKLAAQGAVEEVEEPEIQAASQQVHFGGANIPGKRGAVAREEAPSPDAWPDASNETVAEQMPSELEITDAPNEFTVPAEAEKEAEPPVEAATTFGGNNEGLIEFDSPSPVLSEPSESDLTPESLVVDTLDAIPKTVIPALPEIHIAPSPVEQHVPAIHEPFIPFRDADRTSSRPDAAVEEAPLNTAAIDAATEDIAAKPAVDQATVDDVVAKVISKLEPQLHEALANGVLRPLVEELLKQQREKK